MWPFKKPVEVEEAEVIEKEETAIETIEVRDIRQYLVDEYERASKLKDLLDEQEKQLDAATETENKYAASLVTLDEYSRRLKRQEVEIERLKDRLEKEKQQTKEERDEANIMRVKLNHAEPEKAAEEARRIAADLLLASKGSLSRRRAADIVLGVEPVTVPLDEIEQEDA